MADPDSTTIGAMIDRFRNAKPTAREHRETRRQNAPDFWWGADDEDVHRSNSKKNWGALLGRGTLT